MEIRKYVEMSLIHIFVAVEKISEKEISYYWHKKRITIAADSFLDIWSGIALIPEADDKSIEPDYKLHKKEELLVRCV